MNEMSSDENNDDEFECSECDYRCTSEIDIMQHSTVHQSPNTINDDVLDISPYGNFVKDEPNVNDTVRVNLQAKFNSEEEIVSCTKQADTPEIKDIGTYKYKVKRDSNSSTTEVDNRNEIGNKIIKLEDIDIKQENLPNCSSHQINEYEFIHRDQYSLSLNPSKTIPINGRHKAYDENLYTEDDAAVDESESLLNQSEPSQNDMGLTNSSHGLPPNKICHVRISSSRCARIEVEAENTGIYIPPGWKRKVYMSTNPIRGIMRFKCFYFTGFGICIRSKKMAYAYYADKDNLSDIDIAKLNFSTRKSKLKMDQITLEVDLDNTGIYIPDGWQRKVYVSTSSHGQKMYHVNYFNLEGKRFGCKSDVNSYISHSDNIKEKQIDVKEMNFSWRTRNRFSYKKRCKSGKVQGKI
ncbi:unnamed protein product, partial [Meganyctiphanes norvegica]